MHKILIAIILCGAAQIAQAQEPRLNGTWKLNLSKSYMAGEHPLQNYGLTWVIEQNSSRVVLVEKSTNPSFANIRVPDTETRSEIVPDGVESEVMRAGNMPGAKPSSAVIKAEWQGSTLLITERGAAWGGPALTLRRIFVSNDGAQLCELLEVHSPMLDAEERLVFERVK